jgi:hypothetical protein
MKNILCVRRPPTGTTAATTKNTSRILTCLGEIEFETAFFGFINIHATAARIFMDAVKTQSEFAVPVCPMK